MTVSLLIEADLLTVASKAAADAVNADALARSTWASTWEPRPLPTIVAHRSPQGRSDQCSPGGMGGHEHPAPSPARPLRVGDPATSSEARRSVAVGRCETWALAAVVAPLMLLLARGGWG